MHHLLQKGTFIWSENCDLAFNSLKRKLMSAPVLGYPQIGSTFYHDTDASKNGIGAVLSQNQGRIESIIAYSMNKPGRKELLCNSEGTTDPSPLHAPLLCLSDWTALCGSHWSRSLAMAPRIQTWRTSSAMAGPAARSMTSAWSINQESVISIAKTMRKSKIKWCSSQIVCGTGSCQFMGVAIDHTGIVGSWIGGMLSNVPGLPSP